MTTGEKIKKLRKENNLTQEKLAELVDVSLTSIRRWEWGENTPNSKFIQRLSEILNVPPEELLSDKEEEAKVKGTSEKKLMRNEGMATIELEDGRVFSVPATSEGYAFLERIYAMSMGKVANA